MILPPNSNMDSQTLLNQIIIDYMKEQKRKRRWRWVMRVIFLLLIAYVCLSFILFYNEEMVLIQNLM